MKKQFLKSRPVCKVTFAMPVQAAGDSQRAHLVGDFNEWQIGATPLKRRKDGTYAATVELKTGREYQYRFVVDDGTWVNDPAADGYVPTPYGNDHNCVVSV